MNIVSLLPGTTEIVAALGKEKQLVGRSHECDFPSGLSTLPACTEPKFKADGSSYEIDQRLKALVQEGLSVYRVDADKLSELDPDIIITQDQCEACAASLDEVKQAVHSQLEKEVEIISVSPTDLSSVVQSIRTIADAIDAGEAARRLTEQMKSDLRNIQQQAASLQRPVVLALEWLDPLMSAGNWVPELIQLAGGNPIGSESGEHSPWIEWDSVRRWNPEIITLMPCGYSIEKTLSELPALTSLEGWNELKAVRNKQVFVVDGNQYFNRPGPRLVESTQILAEIIHPSAFRTPAHNQKGWINLSTHEFYNKVRAI